MAATATDVLSLADAKQELKVIDTNQFDAKITNQIAAAVSFVERQLGRPLIDAETIVDCWRPGDTDPLCVRMHDVDRVVDVEYWSTDSSLREDPDDGVTVADLGRIDTRPDQTIIYPPAGGWPEILSGSWLRVSMVRAFDTERHPSVRQAVVVALRMFYAGDGMIGTKAAVYALIDPWMRREPSVQLTA